RGAGVLDRHPSRHGLRREPQALSLRRLSHTGLAAAGRGIGSTRPAHSDDRHRDVRLTDPLRALGHPRRAWQRLSAHGPRPRCEFSRSTGPPRYPERLGAGNFHSRDRTCLDAAGRRRGRTGVFTARPRLHAASRHRTARLSERPGRVVHLDAARPAGRFCGRSCAAAHRSAAARSHVGDGAMTDTDLIAAPPETRTRRSWTFTAGVVVVGLHVVIGLLTLFWTPYDPTAMSGGRLEMPSLIHIAGTDRLGRDLLTLIMIGSRIALIVGTGAIVIGGLIGITVGLLAAFASRTLDDV